MTDPQATYFEDEHRYLFDQQGIEIVIERFRQNRDGDTIADVQPRSAIGPGFLPSEKLNLSSARSIKTYANTLEQRPLQATIDWFALLGKASALSLERLREGEPHVWLDVVDLDAVSRWLVYPFVVDRAISMVYGSGGSAKSVFALALALAVATGEDIGGLQADDTGHVLVLDWEDDAETWSERLRALCVGHGVELPESAIAYLRMTTSLHEGSREVRKRIAATNARFVVVDSVGMASGGDPNDAGTIMRTLMAARSFGVPVLAIHHIAKDSKDPAKSGPYGSVYATNEVRQSWFISTDQPEGAHDATMSLINAKPNRSARIDRRGFRIRFEDGENGLLHSIGFAETAARVVRDEHAQSNQRYDLVRWLLEIGKCDAKQAAEFLGTSEQRARNLLSDPTAFVKIPGTRPAEFGVLREVNASDRDSTSPSGHSDMSVGGSRLLSGGQETVAW